VLLNGEFFVFGGNGGNGSVHATVFRSADGINWEDAGKPPWQPRSLPAACVLKVLVWSSSSTFSGCGI
jgi:hypothetical protein